MAEQIVIAELQINTQSLQDSSTKLIQEIAKLKAEQKDLVKETKGLTTATDEQSRQYIETDARLKQLNAEYANNKKVLAEASSGVAGLNDVLQKENKTISEAENANKKLSLIRSQITTDTQEGRDAITEINNKIGENNDFIKENSDALKLQKMNVGNYKASVSEALGELNIFNGGLDGFLERSQEAGGSGNLLKNSFNGVKDSVVATTKASLGFLATPLGAALAAIALVVGILYGAFKSFTPLVDKVEQGMAALGAVVNVVKNSVIALVTGAKSLGDVFSNLGGSMRDAAQAAAELKKAQQDLDDAMQQQEVSSAKNRAEINRLNIQAKDRTKTEEERLALLSKAAQLEEKDFKDRKANSDEKLRIAYQEIAIAAELSDAEIKELQKSGLKYKEITEQKTSNNDELYDALKSALLDSTSVENEFYSNQEKNINKTNKLIEDAEAEREKINAQAEKSRDEAIAKNKERQDKIIESMNQELSLFVAKENLKTKTVEQSLIFEQQLSDKRIALLNKELEFGKKSQIQYQQELITIQSEFAGRISENILAQSKAELDLFISQNASKIENGKLLTQTLIDEEAVRLEAIKLDKLNLIEQEKKTNQTIIDAKRANNEELTVADIEYLTAKNNLESEFRLQNKANQDAFDVQTKEQKAEQLIADREIELENAQSIFEEDNIIAQQNYEIELEQLRAKLEKELITKEQFNKLEVQANERKNALISLSTLKQSQAQLGGLQSLGNGMEELFGKSKALSLAMAMINGAQAITSILAQYPKFDGGFAMTAALISAGATTIAQVSKITSTKFERGGLQKIGGKRHSAGGTKFMGEDGTRFEAEEGELIGVMNRNASKAFMEFNNSFPSGSGTQSNYFESGGMFMQNSIPSNAGSIGIDYDLLAMKLSQANSTLPPPIVYASVVDINDGQNNYAQVVSGANH